MAKYRGELDEERERELYSREARLRREGLGSYDEPYAARGRHEEERRPYYNRYGERADYDYNEPRYNESRGRFRGNEDGRSALYEGRDFGPRFGREQIAYRSRLRCRDIMTRDLAVATRDTTLREVAMMMKQEDTGVIPVVDYDAANGNGKATDERNYDSRHYSRGKLVGLITDRDIAVRAVSEGKDCTTTRVEEVMSTDIYTARPNDRVVDVIRTMGNKQVRRIPVTNESSYLNGMISMADVAVETQEDYELSEAIEEISKGSSFWSRIFG
ncbi:MAG TPA: CBS domain-containing protein [Pyrinomonadaceae bacterium]